MEGKSQQQLPEDHQKKDAKLLRRSRSLLGLKYKNKEVKNLLQVIKVYEQFVERLSENSKWTKVENCETFIQGDKNNVFIVGEVEKKTESLLENILANNAHQDLEIRQLKVEIRQLKNLLLAVQRRVETVAETSVDVKSSVESVREMLTVHLDHDQRTEKMVQGIDSLRAWVKLCSLERLKMTTFAQVPQEAKCMVLYLSTQYGDKTDCLIRAFLVPQDIKTPNTDDLCARLLAIWIKQDSNRTVQDLRRLLAETDNMIVTVEVSKCDANSRHSCVESETGYDVSFSRHTSSSSRRDLPMSLEKVPEILMTLSTKIDDLQEKIEVSQCDANSRHSFIESETGCDVSFSRHTSSSNRRDIAMSLEKVPEKLMSLEKVPETLMSLEKAPEMLMSLEKVPETLMSLEKVPEMLMSLEKVPEMLKSLEKVPEMLMSLEKVPEMLMSLEKVPETLMSLEKVPEMLMTLITKIDEIHAKIKDTHETVLGIAQNLVKRQAYQDENLAHANMENPDETHQARVYRTL